MFCLHAWYLWKSEEGTGYPEMGYKWCEPACGCWELKLDPVQKQPRAISPAPVPRVLRMAPRWTPDTSAEGRTGFASWTDVFKLHTSGPQFTLMPSLWEGSSPHPWLDIQQSNNPFLLHILGWKLTFTVFPNHNHTLRWQFRHFHFAPSVPCPQVTTTLTT